MDERITLSARHFLLFIAYATIKGGDSDGKEKSK